MISDVQVDFVTEEINKSKIRHQGLKDDLIDHFCCLIEIEMQKGVAFEKAYQFAFHQTSPNGLDEIQDETLFLLNYNKIRNMKRLTYIAGYVFALSATFGTLFKILHLPGAAMLLLGGLTGLACIFLPLLLINQYKTLISGVLSDKLKLIFGGLSLIFIPAATWLKLAHLQGAGVMLFLGFLIFGFGYLPFLFFRSSKPAAAQ